MKEKQSRRDGIFVESGKKYNKNPVGMTYQKYDLRGTIEELRGRSKIENSPGGTAYL
jgi:hypothetical protein